MGAETREECEEMLGRLSAGETEVSHRNRVKKLEARARVHEEIEAMKAEGKAFVLSAEEEEMLKEFRIFKLRMKKDGETFTWQSRKPESVAVAAPVLSD